MGRLHFIDTITDTMWRSSCWTMHPQPHVGDGNWWLHFARNCTQSLEAENIPVLLQPADSTDLSPCSGLAYATICSRSCKYPRTLQWRGGHQHSTGHNHQPDWCLFGLLTRVTFKSRQILNGFQYLETPNLVKLQVGVAFYCGYTLVKSSYCLILILICDCDRLCQQGRSAH